ncbi:hypothetical protein [Microbacterium resistens]|uniref:hypothetical protein n=1 Tax=Microbacterium resistens TaxID=156977 RepID=UPI0012F80118|nr:hypothetical protein [Microbacterium resistens]
MSTSPALGAGEPVVRIRLDGVPRSGFVMTRQAFLDGGVGLIQRIENRTSGIPSLLEHARTDLASAETERDDAAQRIGQPFRHTQASADVEKNLVRTETQLAAMQEDSDPAAQADTAPESPRSSGLNVEIVRAHRPALGYARTRSAAP